MRLSPVHGKRDGVEPGALPVAFRMEGDDGQLARQSRSQGTARRRHLLRFPAALGRRIARSDLARMAPAAHSCPARVPAADGNQRAAGATGPRGPHRLRDLKLHGVRPFVDAARVYALAFGLAQTGTAERLRAVAADLRMAPPEMAAIVDAFFFIQKLRLRIQARPGTQLRGSANQIDPRTLNDFERPSLKEAFRQARKLQQRLALDYDL